MNHWQFHLTLKAFKWAVKIALVLAICGCGPKLPPEWGPEPPKVQEAPPVPPPPAPVVVLPSPKPPSSLKEQPPPPTVTKPALDPAMVKMCREVEEMRDDTLWRLSQETDATAHAVYQHSLDVVLTPRVERCRKAMEGARQ